MAQIEFTDWNHYTDAEGSAQTLDWADLPAFMDFNTGMTALVSALNEKIKVINFLSGDVPNSNLSSVFVLTPLHTLKIMKDFDTKLESITGYFFDLEVYPSLSRYTRYYLLKAVIETESDTTWVEAVPFVPLNKWLYQRYLVLNKLLFLVSRLAYWRAFPGAEALLRQSETVNLVNNTFQYLINDFHSKPYTPTSGFRPLFNHFVKIQYQDFPKEKYGEIQRYVFRFIENLYNSELVLGYDLHAYRGVVAEFYDEWGNYENNDSLAPEGVAHEYIMSSNPIPVSSSFDSRDYYDLCTVTDFSFDPTISVRYKGYASNTWFGQLSNQLWIYKLNVPGGFKFQP